MKEYSIAKVIGDLGFASEVSKSQIIKARSYRDAVKRAVEVLDLNVGDKLSIIRIPAKGFGRFEYTIRG